MADSIENLKRWIESKAAEKWVAEHCGEWNHDDWLSLLAKLQEDGYSPIAPDGVGKHLESRALKYRFDRDRILAKADEASLRPAMRMYIEGLAVVGFVSGFFAGASHTPIVGTLLPLLFALIGGTSGLYLVTADLASPALASRLQWLGKALGFFGVACLLGSVVGIFLRLQYEDPHRNELVTVWHGRTQAAIQLAALRAKLDLLGVSAVERAKVMAAAGKALDDEERLINANHLREVASQASKVETELKVDRDKAVAAHLDVPKDVDVLISQLEYFCHQTEPWLSSGMPRDLYRNNIKKLWLSLINMPSGVETDVFVHQAGYDAQNLDMFFKFLNKEFRDQDDLDWELGGVSSDRLDKLLEEVSKSAKPAQESKEIINSM